MSDENDWCFACGSQNPLGLHLKFQEINDTYQTQFTGKKEHQGYAGILHGGIISTLLDEVTAGYLYAKGLHALTARLEVRYRHPTPIDQPLTVSGRIHKVKGKVYELFGKIQLADGTVTAEGKTTAIVLKDDK
ncbi:acyl-coenzyme A thioesterase PaaI-like protein [Sporomusaceae bacterium BoRhaA]|jgi:acyl-coenzyme A thioesterase PaaI-like protein|uniref:PaaI family thioesterase n=1 Tax=Pelorhabdus rhamnosifermentans TaxID=2772457 RepID=UPI001C05FD89|nr:PaaI family thioesterase [Pelorhabdus rhamnosifermentans]MBU2699265.1 acyl-coenzyme A thioesterase PaaI-like protein [Pelorhabdus rhamnosifermentans]